MWLKNKISGFLIPNLIYDFNHFLSFLTCFPKEIQIKENILKDWLLFQ